MSRSGVLVDVEELQALRRSSTPLRLLDVRWRLGGPSGHEQFLAGHIPGAIFVDLDRELAGEASPRAGRHPLPSVDRLQAAARRWGLRQGETVVAYDDGGSMSAARAWWLLRWGGVESVFLLDGGLGAWLAAGGQLATGPGLAEPGDVELSPGHMPTVLIDAVAEVPKSGLLLDARAAERFRGEAEPVDPKAGHIPGAVSAPTTENLTVDGRFRPDRELEDRFSRLGAGGDVAIAVYCGSGVTAAHEIAALAVAGLQAALYPGSWSQWSNHEDRPVATGPG
jgi:thiosulfate/3-mercaptopyruvate sulfurtransferase